LEILFLYIHSLRQRDQFAKGVQGRGRMPKSSIDEFAAAAKLRRIE